MKKTAVDAADIRILCALQQHGQLSKAKLAALVSLSPTPCWTRFAKLKKAGLIHGYHADVALSKIVDVAKVVVTISLKSHRKTVFKRFEDHIRQLDEVVDCIATGGGMDYVMTVVTANLGAFQELMDVMLAAELGIERYMTYIVTREIKSVQPNLALLATVQEK